MRVSQKQFIKIVTNRRKAALSSWLLVAGLVCVAIAGGGMAITRNDLHGDSERGGATAHSAAKPSSGELAAAQTKFAVSIRQPAGPPRVLTGLRDFHGNEVTAACSTCHTTRPPNVQNKSASDLKEFHGGMKFSHGKVSCLSCHNPSDYDALKLADGSRVEFSNVMTLCAQCHGPQMQAYKHGAHGGMNGYWDLKRGPQVKNNCIDCHDPHAPQFPKMRPTFKPKDRFLEQTGAEH